MKRRSFLQLLSSTLFAPAAVKATEGIQDVIERLPEPEILKPKEVEKELILPIQKEIIETSDCFVIERENMVSAAVMHATQAKLVFGENRTFSPIKEHPVLDMHLRYGSTDLNLAALENLIKSDKEVMFKINLNNFADNASSVGLFMGRSIDRYFPHLITNVHLEIHCTEDVIYTYYPDDLRGT